MVLMDTARNTDTTSTIITKCVAKMREALNRPDADVKKLKPKIMGVLKILYAWRRQQKRSYMRKRKIMVAINAGISTGLALFTHSEPISRQSTPVSRQSTVS